TIGIVVLLSRCGSPEQRFPHLGRPGAAPTDAGSGGAESGLPFGAAGDFGNVVFADGSACAAEVRRGELLPLDLYIMLDRSASMNAVTGSGATKWDAVTSALRGFVEDDRSAGLGVGLQYFPLLVL